MKSEEWGEEVPLCFLSRSWDAVCLGRAHLAVANRFPCSLQELFLKTIV